MVTIQTDTWLNRPWKTQIRNYSCLSSGWIFPCQFIKADHASNFIRVQTRYDGSDKDQQGYEANGDKVEAREQKIEAVNFTQIVFTWSALTQANYSLVHWKETTSTASLLSWPRIY